MCRFALCFVDYPSSQMLSALLPNLAEIVLEASVNQIPPQLAFPFSTGT